ncbi:hypothetical protein Bbelb_413040, partial [Branchiostoma belcheri]
KSSDYFCSTCRDDVAGEDTAVSSSTFPACYVPDEPQDGQRLLCSAAVIMMLLLVAVATVNTTSAKLPPYRSWGYSIGTDPGGVHNTRKRFLEKPVLGDDHTPDDMFTREAAPTNDPDMPPVHVDKVRPPIQGPTVFGGSVQEEIDGMSDIFNATCTSPRLRIRKQIYEILNREFDPKMPPASYKMTQSALKPHTSTNEKTKGEMGKTGMATKDEVQVTNATEMNFVTTKTRHATSREARLVQACPAGETVALAVVGVVTGGSVHYSYSCTAQIT